MISGCIAEGTCLVKTVDLEEAGFTLEYYITESSCEYEDTSEQTVYGVEVVKRQGDRVEKSSIGDYSLYRDKTEELAEKLSRNLVTPVSFIDVMSDIIGV